MRSKLLTIGIIFSLLSQVSHTKEDGKKLALARRSLIERELMYMKKQPMSKELRAFIDNHSKKSREKREETPSALDETQMRSLVPTNKIAKKRSFTAPPSAVLASFKSAKNSAANEAKHIKVKRDKDNQLAETTSENESQVLNKILQDVEGLVQWKQDGHKKEGVLCGLNGSWISEAAGMRLDFNYKDPNQKKFRVHLAERIPPNEEGFLCGGNWSVFGELPFKHSGMVIALAVHQKDKHLATFIGECRICEGSETVTGTWLIGRSSRDCKDQKAAHKVLSDVWKREQGHTLRKKHLQQLGYTVRDDD